MGAAALAIVGRWWLLVTRPLWHDEVFTVWLSRLTPGRLLRTLRLDSGPPLFYLAEKPLVAAAEALALPDTAARLLSFLAVAALLAAGRDPRAGFRRRFLWLAASSPFLLLYASEARAYAVLSLLGFVLFRLVTRESPGPGTLAAIALATAALVWTHYLGLVLTLSLLTGALLARRGRAAAALGLGVLSFLPWAPVLLAQPAAATGWIRDRIGVSAGGFLAALGGSVRVLPPFGRPVPEPLLWLAAAVAVASIALLLLLSTRDSESRIGLCAVLLTLGGILVVSLWRPIAIAGRSEMAVLPIWLWIAARAGEKSSLARQAVLAMAVLGTVSSLFILVSPRPTHPFAQVPENLEASARAGDLIVATANFYLPAVLARDRGLLAGELRALPSDLADHPGWFPGQLPTEQDYRRLAEDLSRVSPDRAVFLLLDSPYWTPRLRALLLARGPFRSFPAPPAGLWVASPGRAPRLTERVCSRLSSSCRRPRVPG